MAELASWLARLCKMQLQQQEEEWLDKVATATGDL